MTDQFTLSPEELQALSERTATPPAPPAAPAAPASAPKNPFELSPQELSDISNKDLASRLGTVLPSAAGADPKKEGRKALLAKELGLDVGALPSLDAAELEAFLKKNDPNELAANTPRTAAWLSANEHNAKSAARSIDQLVAAEKAHDQLISTHQAYAAQKASIGTGLATGFLEQFKQAYYGLKLETLFKDLFKTGAGLDNPSGVQAPLDKNIPTIGPRAAGDKPSAEDVATAIKSYPLLAARTEQRKEAEEALKEVLTKTAESEARVKAATPEFDSTLGRWVYGGVASTLQSLPGIGTSIATRNPVPALSYFGVTQYGPAFAKYTSRSLEQGNTPLQAYTNATIGAGVETTAELGFEALPLGFILDKFGHTGWKEFAVGLVLREIPTEVATTIVQKASDYSVANPNATWEDFRNTLPDDIGATITGVLIQSAFLGGASHVTSRLSTPDRDRSRELIQSQQALAEAQQNFAHYTALGNLLQAVQGSELRDVNPDAFKDHIKSLKDENVDTDVYVSAQYLGEAFAQNGISEEEVGQKLPEIVAQLQESRNNGTQLAAEVRVPVEDFLTHFPEQIAQDIVREGLATSEAFYQQQLSQNQELAKRIIEEGAKDSVLADEVRQVQSRIVEGLVSTGRYTRSVAETNAIALSAFYLQNARDKGISVTEFEQQYGLKFAKAPARTGRGFDQKAARTKATFEDFAPGKVKDILQKDDWAVLTAENPNAQELSPEENAQRQELLKARLEELGLKFQQVRGKYGAEENALLVLGVTPAQTLQLIHEFEQESALLRQGLVYRDGTVAPARGVSELTAQPDDYYTSFPETGSTVQVDIDFDSERVALETAPGAGGTGRDFTNFFTGVTEGKAGTVPKGAYVRVLDTSSIDWFTQLYNKHTGNFDAHIKASIPGYGEVQQAVGAAIVQAYKEQGGRMLDIGASEGSLVKAISEASDGRVETTALDPNVAMAKFYNEHSTVAGSEYAVEALGSREEEGTLAWTEDDGTEIKYFDPHGVKFDVVHEAMTFQFISPDRGQQVARVKELLADNGVALFEQKFFENTPAWKANEAKKNLYKSQYFTGDEIAKKEQEILSAKAEEKVVGMHGNMVSSEEFENVLTDNFKYVVQFWDSGNFKGYAASDSAGALATIVGNMIDLSSEYATVRTPRAVTESFAQSATLRKGTENLKKYGLDPDGRHTTREVAAALEARQRAKYGTIDPKDRSPEASNKIANWMVQEVLFEMENPGASGVGWYSTKFQNALDTLGSQFPELLTDQNARNTMTALIAITSDGQKVVPNFLMAADYYSAFRKDGKFSSTRGHQRIASIEGNVAKLQELYDLMGVEKAHQFLLEERTVGELNKIARKDGKPVSTNYQADTIMPLAALTFGPKLGAFYANLMGSHGYLTMDRWWSRTFNRYRGTLLMQPTQQGLARFRELLGKPDLSDDETIAATVQYRDAYAAKNYKDGTEIEKAANTIYKAAFEGLEDVPFNATDRTFMIDTVERAQQKLKGKGHEISIADIQAVLWYYEKRLYGELGARQSADVSYEDAAQRVAEALSDSSGRSANQLLQQDAVEGPSRIGTDEYGNPLSGFAQSGSWYYSALERTILDIFKIADKKGEVKLDQAIAWLDARQKEGKFRKAELEAIGLNDLLDLHKEAGRQTIGAEELIGFVQDNGFQLEETVLGTPSVEEKAAALQRYIDATTAYNAAEVKLQKIIDDKGLTRAQQSNLNWWALDYVDPATPEMKVTATAQFDKLSFSPEEMKVIVEFGTAWKAFTDADKAINQQRVEGPRHTQFTLPGGADHKEIVLYAPQVKPFAESDTIHYGDIGEGTALAWTRVNTRFDTDGKKVLFVEEIQSKRAQVGRKEGFATSPRDTTGWHADLQLSGRYAVTDENGNWMSNYSADSPEQAIERAAEARPDTRIPPAPFVTETKEWTGLVLKRLVRYAAENGFDKVAWTTGEQQADRYRLSNKIEKLSVYLDEREGGPYYMLKAFEKGSRRPIERLGGYYTAADLPGVIGQELADKVLSQKQDVHHFEGLDLRTGGEGMVKFYEGIIPQVANKVLKDLKGGKVGTVEVVSDNNSVGRDIAVRELPSGEALVVDRKSGQYYNDDTQQWQDAEPDLPLVSVFGAEQVAARLNKAASALTQPGFEITDAVRENALAGQPLFQENNAEFYPKDLTAVFLEGSNLSSVIHETGHYYLEVLTRIASEENAPERVRRDVDTTLKWFGIEGFTPEQRLAKWRAMSVDAQRPYHEQWAQSFERWTLEGEAPAAEMQTTFARFRSWMLQVYKSVKDFLTANPLAGKLNDDIRTVFSQMLASEDAIAHAEQVRAYAPLFNPDSNEAQNNERIRKYLRLNEEATDAAVTEMQKHSMRDLRWASNLKDRAIKALQAEAKEARAAIREEVAKQVAQEPIEQAKTFLQKGELVSPTGEEVKAEKGFKLDLDALKAMYPASGLDSIDISQLRKYSGREGLHPDLVAQMFGFESGDALVRTLLSDENTQSKIEGLTDSRMLEEHGELTDSRSIELAAEAAIHNDIRARFLATGLKLLEKTPGPARDLAKASKATAERIIAGKKVRDLTPGQYSRAETKANKEAIKQAAANPAKAAEAQRAALLSHQLTRATIDAMEEIKKAVNYLKGLQNLSARKSIDIEYMEQIEEMLKPFDLSTGVTLRELDRRQSLTQFIAEHEALGLPPAIDPEYIARLESKSYKEMTVEEVRGLVDAVKQVEHLGRLKKKLLAAKDKREFQTVIDAATASIIENANRTVRERATPADVAGKVGLFFRRLAAAHRKFASFIREMDGGKDGGAMWDLLSRSMNEAGDTETAMHAEATNELAKIFAPIQRALRKSNIAGNLWARRAVVPGTNISMTHEERVMFGMNWGNQGNRQRLLDGGMTGKKALSAQEAAAILDTLTKEEWDFIQNVWDYIGSYRQRVGEQERRLTGVTPEWVDPAPVVTKFGTYPGGYFPAKYDAELSTRSESLDALTDLRQNAKGALGRAAASSSYAKARADAVVGRPLLLNFDTITRHVNEVIHRLAWQDWLIDANRVLKALDQPIREHYGPEVLREMQDTVRDIAIGQQPARDVWERGINHIRTGSTIVGLGWRFSTALLQPAGLAQSWSRVGTRWMFTGVTDFMKSPLESAQFVNEKSKLMRDRGRTMQREINEIMNTIRTGKTVQNLNASFFWAIGKTQRFVDIPTWLGAYEKALAQNGMENATTEEERKAIDERAVALADQAVIDSQSGGMDKDLAGIQRGSPLKKLFTNFYSYFSATYNLNVEAYRRTDFTSPLSVAAFASDLLVLNTIPALFSVVLKQLLKGDCDWETECLAEKAIQEQINYLSGQTILTREAGAGLNVYFGESYGYQGPAGLRFFADLYKLNQQVAQGEADLAAFKALNNVAGALLHYPAGQVNSTLDGIMAVEDGRVQGVNIIGALMAGAPKE